MDLFSEAKTLLPRLVEYRRALHQIAEVGFDTEKTNAFITGVLKEHSIPHRPCGGGILATLGNGEGGILLRADTDALPIKEESGLPFAATGGTCHGCGHDMHTAMLLGALTLLNERRHALSRAVTLMFQPAEELLTGAQAMIEDGALSSAPRFAYALHVLVETDAPTGTVFIPPVGASAAASDFFSVLFKGKGAHGAMPEASRHPLRCAAHALLALESLVGTEVGADRQATLSVGYLNGGEACNVIPDTARLGGSIRTHDEQTRALLLKRIPLLCESFAAAFGVRAVFSHESHCPALLADESARTHAIDRLSSLCPLVPKKEIPPFAAKPRGGSEDFAFIAERIPSLMLSLASGQRGRGFSHPLHHPAVTFDEDALPFGAAALAALAYS